MLSSARSLVGRTAAAALRPAAISSVSRSAPLLRLQRSFASAAAPTPKPAEQKEEEEYDDEREVGVSQKDGQSVTWASLAFMLVAGGGAVSYLLWAQDKTLNTVRVESIGTPKIGGSWTVQDDMAKTVTSADFHGKYPLIYFGFTHCPDICPRELERMDEIIKKLDAVNLGNEVVPIFITIDPKRDTVARMRVYKEKWNPRIRFLVPTDAELKDIAAKFRLYYSASETNPGEEDDYLLDHSIFFYMMDREGQFMDVYSQWISTDDVAHKIAANIHAENAKK